MPDVQLWLAMDPRSRRVLAQSSDWRPGDFPPGTQEGQDWPRRTVEANDGDFARVLAGGVPAEELDALHRGWWDAAEPV